MARSQSPLLTPRASRASIDQSISRAQLFFPFLSSPSMDKQFGVLARVSRPVGRSWGHISYSYDVGVPRRRQRGSRKTGKERGKGGRSRQTQMSRVCSFSYAPRCSSIHTTFLTHIQLMVTLFRLTQTHNSDPNDQL